MLPLYDLKMMLLVVSSPFALTQISNLYQTGTSTREIFSSVWSEALSYTANLHFNNHNDGYHLPSTYYKPSNVLGTFHTLFLQVN